MTYGNSPSLQNDISSFIMMSDMIFYILEKHFNLHNQYLS